MPDLFDRLNYCLIILYNPNIQASCTHHVGPVHRGAHLDFPEVLALSQGLGATDSRRAAAVVLVEAGLPVLAAQGDLCGLTGLLPHPLESWGHGRYGVTIMVASLLIL